MASSSRTNDEDPWSSSEDDDDDEICVDDDDDDERVAFRSICSYSHLAPAAAPTFATPAAALAHDATHHGFDLLRHVPASRDEDAFFEGTIALVNRCRRFVRDRVDDGGGARELGAALEEFLARQPATAAGAADYKPVLEDDALLMCIDELQELKRRDEQKSGGGATTETEYEARDTVHGLRDQVALLEEKLARAQALIASLAKEDDASGDKEGRSAKGAQKKKKAPDNDSYYFNSYSNTTIHETMLRDTVRTAAYEEAILSNEALFRGKTVLDLGCGTGVLSLFCAKAGAKKVIAVDNSDIINQAKEIVKLNGFEHVVACVRGKMETLLATDGLPLSPGETVDVIVSEWMGYALFFETMLPSVLAARDAIMTPATGTMFPNVSTVFLEAGNASDRLNYWDDVHALDMAPMKARVAGELTRDAWVEVVEDKDIVTDRAKLIAHDLNTCQDADLDFAAPFELRLRDAAPSDGAVEVHQLVVSFDIDFAVPGTKRVGFSTGCQTTPTHWKQTVLWFDPLHNCPRLDRVTGESMRGTFHLKRGAVNHRDIDMAVVWETGRRGEDGAWVRSMEGVLKRSLIA